MKTHGIAMKKHRSFVRTAALALSALLALPATAQPAPSLTEGEVRKIDRDAGKITIKHGEIKHMEMPPMTMVFVVKDAALLDKTSVGARVQFMAVSENGRMTVTEIQPAK